MALVPEAWTSCLQRKDGRSASIRRPSAWNADGVIGRAVDLCRVSSGVDDAVDDRAESECWLGYDVVAGGGFRFVGLRPPDSPWRDFHASMLARFAHRGEQYWRLCSTRKSVWHWPQGCTSGFSICVIAANRRNRKASLPGPRQPRIPRSPMRAVTS